MLEFHHVNVVSDAQPELSRFYRDVMGLHEAKELAALRQGPTYQGATDFLSDGRFQVHVSRRDLGVAFRTGQTVNPVATGHIGFRTDDMAAFLARLDALGVPYSDYGTWAMSGWHQVFFYDPAGTVVEVHQVQHPG
jgi:catechol 2,3-dioxygenase-like lactoylglutathione lyase family enzyme